MFLLLASGADPDGGGVREHRTSCHIVRTPIELARPGATRTTRVQERVLGALLAAGATPPAGMASAYLSAGALFALWPHVDPAVLPGELVEVVAEYATGITLQGSPAAAAGSPDERIAQLELKLRDLLQKAAAPGLTHKQFQKLGLERKAAQDEYTAAFEERERGKSLVTLGRPRDGRLTSGSASPSQRARSTLLAPPRAAPHRPRAESPVVVLPAPSRHLALPHATTATATPGSAGADGDGDGMAACHTFSAEYAGGDEDDEADDDADTGLLARGAAPPSVFSRIHESNW